MAEQSITIPSLDGVCLVNLEYFTEEGKEDLKNARVGSIIRVTDVDKAVRFIEYPAAAKPKED